MAPHRSLIDYSPFEEGFEVGVMTTWIPEQWKNGAKSGRLDLLRSSEPGSHLPLGSPNDHGGRIMLPDSHQAGRDTDG